MMRLTSKNMRWETQSYSQKKKSPYNKSFMTLQRKIETNLKVDGKTNLPLPLKEISKPSQKCKKPTVKEDEEEIDADYFQIH